MGGTYDFGPVKLYANYHRHQAFNDRQVHVMVGASMPVGAGVIKLSAARANRSGPGLDADDATQFAVGYVHWLSKRTAVYTAYSRIRNRGNAAYVVADSSPAGSPGMPSSGLQFGISHNF